jgi:RNA polymerase sigma-70 factor (ECF subfamily)
MMVSGLTWSPVWDSKTAWNNLRSGTRCAVGNDDDCAFFRAEIERLTDRLYGVALRLTGNPAAAEDLVSEAALKAWSNLGQLHDRQAFPKWILRILANTFVSSYRKARQEPEVALDEEGEEQFSLFEQLHQPFLLWWSNPEQDLINKLLRADLERALGNLPDGFRVIMVMVEIEGYSYAEVADMLGIPIGTVRSRLNRARSMLQRALWRQAREAGLATTAQQRSRR